jgi:hypothetical protein
MVLDQAYWALQFNYRAVNMSTVAPFDTVRLTAVPINVAGAPLATRGLVTYRTLDSAVSVDSTGLVTAHSATESGSWARIIASLQDSVANLTHADTAFIQVTDTVPHIPLDTFSLRPTPEDSAKRSVDDDNWFGAARSFAWPVHAADRVGHTLCDTTTCPLLVDYRSANPVVATIDRATGQVTAAGIGRTRLTASTWAYGVVMRDSILFTIGHRISYNITIGLSDQSGDTVASFGAPPKVTLGVGAIVTFLCAPVTTTACAQPIDVTFDHQTAIDTASAHLGRFTLPTSGSGNIPAFGGDPNITQDARARRFRAPGTYRFYSTLFPSDTFDIVITSDP